MFFILHAGDGRGFRTSALNSNGPLAHDLIYSDGHVTGTPLTYMGPTEMEIGVTGWSGSASRSPTMAGRWTGACWLAAYRKGGQPADLLVRLEREDGTALATGAAVGHGPAGVRVLRERASPDKGRLRPDL